MAQIFRIDFGYRQAMAAKVAGEFHECDIFSSHVIQNTDGTQFIVGKANDLAARAAELALQRLHPIDRQLEMLLEKSLENFHEKNFTNLVITSIKITLCTRWSR